MDSLSLNKFFCLITTNLLEVSPGVVSLINSQVLAGLGYTLHTVHRLAGESWTDAIALHPPESSRSLSLYFFPPDSYVSPSSRRSFISASKHHSRPSINFIVFISCLCLAESGYSASRIVVTYRFSIAAPELIGTA